MTDYEATIKTLEEKIAMRDSRLQFTEAYFLAIREACPPDALEKADAEFEERWDKGELFMTGEVDRGTWEKWTRFVPW